MKARGEAFCVLTVTVSAHLQEIAPKTKGRNLSRQTSSASEAFAFFFRVLTHLMGLTPYLLFVATLKVKEIRLVLHTGYQSNLAAYVDYIHQKFWRSS